MLIERRANRNGVKATRKNSILRRLARVRIRIAAQLKEIRDPKERKAFLAGKVEDMLNTVVRQIAFYTFERKVHEARRQGELTPDQLNAIWLEVQTESLGPGVELKPGYEVFWTYVPHFIHSPFYVYAYAFGDCLVNSLLWPLRGGAPGLRRQVFRYARKPAAPSTTLELLAPFGLDASKPEFWQKGLKVIEGMIDELERADAAA